MELQELVERIQRWKERNSPDSENQYATEEVADDGVPSLTSELSGDFIEEGFAEESEGGDDEEDGIATEIEEGLAIDESGAMDAEGVTEDEEAAADEEEVFID